MVIGHARQIDHVLAGAAAGDADIGLARLARAVDDAAEHRQRQRRRDMLRAAPPAPATVRITSKPCRAQLGQETTRTPRVRRPSAFRISKPTRTSSSGSAESETRIVSPIPAHSRLPMPIAILTVPPISPPASVMPRCSGQSTASASCLIGGDGEEHVGRLHRHLVFVEIVVLQQLDMVERAFDQRLGAGLAVFFEQVLLQAAGVDADADRAAIGLGGVDHFLHALRRADIAGIDAQAGRAGVGRFERALVVEMDVGDDRHARRAHDLLQRARSLPRRGRTRG